MQARDDFIHFALRNWAAHQNEEWQDGPRANPNPANWQGQIVNDRDANFPDVPMVVDHESAERVQDSMMRCKRKDLETYWVLTLFYSDSQDVGLTKLARGRFWRWL